MFNTTSKPNDVIYIRIAIKQQYPEMLQTKYPSLLNLSNFISLPQYEAKFQDGDVNPDQLFSLINSLKNHNDGNTDKPNEYNISTSLEYYLSIASYCKLIILHPHLNDLYLSLEDIFKVWEIRLNFLLMATNLKPPKTTSVIPPIPNAKFLRNEVNLLLNELIKIKSQKDDDGTATDNIDNMPSEVSWNFKVLINRIKNGSGLLLLNYYYNQLLKLRQAEDKRKINVIMFSLSSLLLARQQYLTLFNLLTQFLDDSKSDSKDPESESFKQLRSNCSLIITLTGLLMLFKDNSSVDENSIYFKDIKSNFQKVNKQSLNQLIDVLSKVAPIHTTNLSKSNTTTTLKISDLNDLGEVIKLVQELKITGRIACSLCAEFEMGLLFKQNENDETVESFDDSLDVIGNEWKKTINNYYAYE
ncbi:unnamed protein product [Ambrosiozyma monospora]|uniref:Unnamed protein product n=1 Tax=Ambrosiozyma monospora TaxID=43982 RepID=A0A9W7DEC9_AMBMO|nr:unnamed protein product [Ambrosiozyma monospora]